MASIREIVRRKGRTTVQCPCCGIQPIKERTHDTGQFGLITTRGCSKCGKLVKQCDEHYFISER